MKLRKVIVSKSVRQPPGEFPRWLREPIGEASFHQFGLGLAETDTSCASYTTAIIEWPDGRVESIDPDHMQFVESIKATSAVQHLVATLRNISQLDYSHAAINGAAYDAVQFAKTALSEYEINQ